IYAPPDIHSRHLRVLQELVPLPPGDLSANYLNATLLIEIAVSRGADALHPGYGFLSENPDFAEAVMAAGLIWVGPPPQAMRALGDKIAAKNIAAEQQVPALPWIKLQGQPDEARVKEIAREIGLPLLIKAARYRARPAVRG